uniref:Uncharacterized protein n=1 Tax=Tetranychus urticae TaxID=32264 RepID=T1JZE9_TETUR
MLDNITPLHLHGNHKLIRIAGKMQALWKYNSILIDTSVAAIIHNPFAS